MDRYRILYVITRANLGGAQANLLDLIDGFRERHDVHLASGEEGPLTERARTLGIHVHRLPNLVRRIDPRTDLGSLRESVALIRRIKPDLVHAHSSKAGIVARLAGRIAGVPVVFTAHGWGFNPGTPPPRRAVAFLAEKAVAPLAARVICVSDHDRRLALRLRVGGERSLVTVRYGIAIDAGALADPAAQPPRFLMVARFNEQKDQATLLRALARVSAGDGGDGAHIDFAGSGPSLARCKTLAETLGIVDRVSFLGDRHDVPALLARAQGFILSTHYEGLPISIMEAMRAGLPVVATDVSGIAEEVVDEETGLLVPHRDVGALAAAIERLINAPALRRRLGEAGRQKFLGEFTIDRMLAETESTYRDVLAPPGGRDGNPRRTAEGEIAAR